MEAVAEAKALLASKLERFKASVANGAAAKDEVSFYVTPDLYLQVTTAVIFYNRALVSSRSRLLFSRTRRVRISLPPGLRATRAGVSVVTPRRHL